MQLLQQTTIRSITPERCAREVLAGIPAVMDFIRQQMRQHRRPELTVPQFRTLVFLSHHDCSSLSEVAEHVGISLSSMSRMVDLLVKRGLLERGTKAGDRRRVSLQLTRRGKSAFHAACSATQVALARSFRALPRRDLERVCAAMQMLDELFATSLRRAKRR